MWRLGEGIRIVRSHRRVPVIRISSESASSDDVYSELFEFFASDRAISSGRALHACLIINGMFLLTRFSCNLIAFYTKCGEIRVARQVFDEMPKRNIRGWMSLISGYSRCGYYSEALRVFSEMQRQGIRLNRFVVPSVLKACGHVIDLETGKKIHALILKFSFETDAFVVSSLVDMYSKCGEIKKAKTVFDGMKEKDLVVFNAVISGLVQSGVPEEGLSLVEEMKVFGINPNVVTWNTLIAGFSRKGDEIAVSRVFELMQYNRIQPDVVSWTSVISGFVKNFRNNIAFDSFKTMMSRGICPTPATISSLLAACGSTADLKRGKEIHAFATTIGVEKDVYVRSALIDMYGKCGCIQEARTLFQKTIVRNTVTWNSMIFAYANHGYCNEAIELYCQMVKGTQKPDHLTFTAALTACSHGGLVELGQNLFTLMQEKYEIKPRAEHYACLVDLLGRAGRIDDAYKAIKTMPVEPDVFVWGALLGACRTHGNIALAEVASKKLHEVEPENAGNKLLLSGLYADAGNWGSVVKMKKSMKKSKSNFPACSWLDTD